jgi:hypothetical protein
VVEVSSPFIAVVDEWQVDPIAVDECASNPVAAVDEWWT